MTTIDEQTENLEWDYLRY